MIISDVINRLDKRYGWSLLGFLLAVIFGTASFYTEFIRDRRPQLRFEVISDASVLDVREQIGNLEIIYDGRDIKKAKQSLRVVVIRISNIGTADVLIGHYDQHSPLGFKVSGGNLLRAEILSASNQYLSHTLRIDTTIADTALFTPVIMESNEWFTVKSLILHPEGSHPAFQAMGKIAGVRELRIVDSTETKEVLGFFSITFSGGVWVQVVRLVAYFIGFILLVVVIFAPFVGLSGFLAKRRRHKHVALFKSLSKRILTEKDEYIFERYVDKDFDYLQMLKRALSDENRLNQEVKRYQRLCQHIGREWRDEPPGFVISSSGAPPSHLYRHHLPVEDMMKSGFIFEREGRWNVNPELRTTLNEFIRFLRIKGVDYPDVKIRARRNRAEHRTSPDAEKHGTKSEVS